MQTIKAIVFEPVGCLAEFPAEHFHQIAVLHYGRAAHKPPSKSGSRAYWHLLNLMQEAASTQSSDELEMQAVNAANIYEDVLPALTELKAMGIQLIVATSLSTVATRRFLQKYSLQECFSSVHTRDSSGGIKAAPLKKAIHDDGLSPQNTMFLSDTAEGLRAAQSAGVISILMMNDPDEARRLAMHDGADKPAGGIVSLHELPDFLRLVAAEHDPRSF